jgi:uncharacterized protein
MRPSPFWVKVAIALSLLLLGLWLVNSIYSLYISIQLPWLANMVLAIVLSLLALGIGFLLHYGGFLRSRLKSKTPEIPADSQAAAELNLQATQQQLGQIQDEVARQALLEESDRMAESLQRGPIEVIIFGTGSVGKTSLINALVGEVVGEVGATMGTTTGAITHTMHLRGLDRQIVLVDTPGILEAGLAGTERGRIAKEQAAAAAMIIFMVDNDLRQSEMDSLLALAAIGKRSLLVLNKADTFSDRDREEILTTLRQRVAKVIPASDVVAVSANPQAVQLADGRDYQPPINITPFLKRFLRVLRDNGETLVADKILQESQQLSQAARTLIDEERQIQADRIINKYQWMSAGAIALNPLPVVDLLAAAAINVQMIVDLGQVYGCQLDRSTAKELAMSLGKTVTGLGILRGSIELITTALKFTVATYLLGKAVQGVTGAYLTRIAGQSFVEYFRRNQDWGDGGITEVVRQQFQLAGREEFVQAFLKEAIGRVVNPLGQQETSPQSQKDRQR